MFDTDIAITNFTINNNIINTKSKYDIQHLDYDKY